MAGISAWRMASSGCWLKLTAPVAGNQPSCRAKKAISSIASQKLGTATPSDAPAMIRPSRRRPWKDAASRPSGTPMATARARASVTISRVWGRQRAMDVATASPEIKERDRSPCRACHSHWPYCTRKGWSSP